VWKSHPDLTFVLDMTASRESFAVAFNTGARLHGESSGAQAARAHGRVTQLGPRELYNQGGSITHLRYLMEKD
jgi:hypothetical protein